MIRFSFSCKTLAMLQTLKFHSAGFRHAWLCPHSPYNLSLPALYVPASSVPHDMQPACYGIPPHRLPFAVLLHTRRLKPAASLCADAIIQPRQCSANHKSVCHFCSFIIYSPNCSAIAFAIPGKVFERFLAFRNPCVNNFVDFK